jgi:DNA repair protein SbcD/Mre11
MKILCTGDLHMGRRSSRLPEHVDTVEHSTTRCWAAIVETAITERVDVVALSGDVVDQANRYYEAIGPFEAALRRLVEHGIRTVAVAGNHDHATLPAIARNFSPDEFTLLGGGGRWERHEIREQGRTVLIVHGWSFPEAFHTGEPLRDFAPEGHAGVPTLGLLHGDLDAPGSRYAPVALAELRRHPMDLWLLGHIHHPRLREAPGAAPVLYPGSPQAMDPGETGTHGVWIAELAAGGPVSLRPVPLSTVRYETLVIDVAAAATVDEVDSVVSTSVRERLRETVERGCGPLRYLSLRLRLTGRTGFHADVGARLAQLAPELSIEHADVIALVDGVVIDTAPDLDLDELARSRDAAGTLARLVRSIEAGTLDAEQEGLLAQALRGIRVVHGARPYRGVEKVPDPPAQRAAALRLLREQSLLLLDTLMAGKAAGR